VSVLMPSGCLRLMETLEYTECWWLDPFDVDELEAAKYLEAKGIITMRLCGKALLIELSKGGRS